MQTAGWKERNVQSGGGKDDVLDKVFENVFQDVEVGGRQSLDQVAES